MFSFTWKEMSQKPLRAAAAKTFLPSACIIDTTCFDECFLFHVITGWHFFLYKYIVTQRFGATAMLLCSLKQVFWKKFSFYVRYPHNNIIMLLVAFRSSPMEVFCRKNVLGNFAKLTGKHLHERLSFNIKMQALDLRPENLLKRLWHRCFSCEFCEISKNSFFRKHLR